MFHSLDRYHPSRRVFLAKVALCSSLALPSVVHAARVQQGDVIITDSSATTPSLPASALDLLVGSTIDNGTLTSSPADDANYQFGSATSYASYGFFPNNRGSSYGVWADSNGYVIWQGMQNREECRGEMFNGVSDSPRCPAHRMAPFWDDLVPVPGTSTITHGATSGQFWYVQWNDFALYNNPNARLTFRVTYLKNSDRIRFNYIKLEGVGSNGAGATIGVHSCGYRNQGYGRFVATWSHDEARLPTGTASAGSSLFAIEFDRDLDGDGLTGSEEVAAGSNPSSMDSDGGGEPDPAEIANGRDPMNGADDVSTDTDGDGLVDTMEALLGTNLAVADSDGDGIDDGAEFLTTRTNPALADTDGDGFIDGAEDADKDGSLDFAEGNPRDPHDVPALSLADSSTTPHAAQFVLDANDNMHIVAANETGSNNVLLYWLVKADGTLGVSQTAIKGDRYVRRPSIALHGGKVYITYMATMGEPDDGTPDVKLGFVRLNTAAHPLDGTPLTIATALEAQLLVDLGYAPRHPDMVMDAAGNLHVVYEDLGGSQGDGTGGASWVRYARLDGSGNLTASAELASYPWTTGNEGTVGQGGPGSAGYGVHKIHSPRIAVDGNGVNIVWVAQTSPDYQYSDYQGYPTGMYYSRIVSSRASGPYYIGPGRIERLDIEARGDWLYVASSNGYDGNESTYMTQGIRFAVIDLANLVAVPRVGDLFGVDRALSSASFVTPWTTVYVNQTANQGMGMTIDENGNALLAFSEDWADTFSAISVSPAGERLGDALRIKNAGDEDSDYWRHKLLARAKSGSLVTLMSEWASGDLRYIRMSGSALPSTAQPAPNRAPVFSTTAPGGAIPVGYRWSYTAAATDDSTAAENLGWYLLAAPPEATMSDDGQLTWVPVSSDAGDWLFGIAVCDDAEVQRCTEQYFVVSVLPGLNDYPPQITSIPSTTALAGRGYQYQVGVADPDLPDDTFTYALVAPSPAPGDMAMSASGLLTWTPSASDLGAIAITVRVTDSAGLSAEQSFSLTITTDASDARPEVILEDGGCGCRSSGASSSLWLALLGLYPLVTGRARRKR